MSLDKRTLFILALIVVAAILFGAYSLIAYRRAHEIIPYSGRVINKETLRTIRGAQVSVDAFGIPPNLYTDSNGIFSFNLDKSIGTVRIRVEAENCMPFDGFVPLIGSVTRSGIEDVRLECSTKKTGPESEVGPLGLTFDHDPTIDEVCSAIERARHVSITYAGNCKRLVGQAVVNLNGAQLNGKDAKELLENDAMKRTHVQFSVVTKQEGGSYEITCDR
jgi:hypothetical protein